MTKIKAILFDAGGVLHESNTAMDDDLLAEPGITSEMLEQIRTTHMALLGSGAIDEAEFWRRITKEYSLRDVSVEENLLGRAFAKALVPHASITEFIRELRTGGYKLAVLSNTIEAHAVVLRRAGVYDGFDAVILSHEVGMLKPDPAIYTYTLGVLGVQPEEAIFIDDLRENVEAAEKLGIHGVVYTDASDVMSATRRLLSEE